MPFWLSQSHQAKHVPKQLITFLFAVKNVDSASIFSIFVKGPDHIGSYKIYVSSLPCETLYQILWIFNLPSVFNLLSLFTPTVYTLVQAALICFLGYLLPSNWPSASSLAFFPSNLQSAARGILSKITVCLNYSFGL